MLVALSLLVLESAAIACSCVAPPDDPIELRQYAAQSMNGAVALVEIEALTTYAPGGSERVRVIRTLAGTAPGEFRIQRGPFASSASCDVTYQAGVRDLVILYSPTEAGPSDLPVFRTSGGCTQGMLSKPAFREEVARLLQAARGASGERG